MPKTLHVRNVPDRLHRRLRQRAAKRSMTLTTYVLSILERDDRVATFDDWLASLRTHPRTVLDVNLADVVRAEREER